MSSVTPRTIPLQDNLVIPTMPAVVQRVTALLQDPNVGLREIALVIAEDAPLAAKVLKIANSTYYGLQERCMSAQQATSVLGVRVLKNVVMQASVIGQFDHLGSQGIDLNELWKHSIVTAQACAFVVRRTKVNLRVTSDEAYACGLLHDLGQVVLLDNLKQRYIELVKSAHAAGAPLFLAEHRAMGFTHADVGALIAQRWGLPPAVARAIGCHHASEKELESDAIVALIMRSNHLVERVASGNAGAASGLFAGQVGATLGVTPEDETALIEFVQRALQTVEI